MSDEITRAQEKAEELGRLISGTAVFKEYKAQHEVLAGDKEAQQLLQDHQEAFIHVRQLEIDGKPVEPEDKHRLQDTQAKLHYSEVLQAYAKAQADFQDLMNRVTGGIHQHIHLKPILDENEDGDE